MTARQTRWAEHIPERQWRIYSSVIEAAQKLGIPFALGGAFPPGALFWPVILCLTLHGVCYDFFFAAGFIHVDNESPSDIRGSAQALFVFLTYGLGMWLGSELSGVIFPNSNSHSRSWRGIPVQAQIKCFTWTLRVVSALPRRN